MVRGLAKHTDSATASSPEKVASYRWNATSLSTRAKRVSVERKMATEEIEES